MRWTLVRRPRKIVVAVFVSLNPPTSLLIDWCGRHPPHHPVDGKDCAATVDDVELVPLSHEYDFLLKMAWAGVKFCGVGDARSFCVSLWHFNRRSAHTQ